MPGPVYRLDLSSGEVRERKRTPQGGLVAESNLTRTGVFPYRNEDGSTRMELRHPDEVFHPDSLRTYPLAPVTVDHPGRVGPDNWREHAVGTVGPDVRQHGSFVRGELHVQDGKTAQRAEDGELREISCGYHCDLDPTPGEYQGQHYDAAQRNIRINHVAIGPPGWGRMGAETRMHLDSGAAVSGEPVTAKEYAAMAAEAEQDSKAATEASNKASAARGTVYEQGYAGKPGGAEPESLFHRSQVHERTAGEHHARAARRHVLAGAAAEKAGDDGAANHHKRSAAAHAHQVVQHAKNAGDTWDNTKHPLAEYEALAKGGFKGDGEAAEKGGSAPTYVRPVTAASTEASTMTEEERKALEAAKAAAAAAQAELTAARSDAAAARTEADKAAAKAREDAATIATLKTENDLLKLQAKPAGQRDDGAAKQGAALAEEQRVEEMIQLREDARLVFATAADPEGKGWQHKGKTPDDIRREVLTHLEPSLKLDGINAIADAGARSQALRVVYDTGIARKRELDKATATALEAAGGERGDGESMGGAGDDDEPVNAEKARKDMVARKRDAWKGKKDKRGGKAA